MALSPVTPSSGPTAPQMCPVSPACHPCPALHPSSMCWVGTRADSALLREGWGVHSSHTHHQGTMQVRPKQCPPCQQPPISPGSTMNPSLSSFIIQDLKPSTLYKVHIMASTAAGGTNGTSLTLVTTVLGEGCRDRARVLSQLHGTAWPEVPRTAPPVTLSLPAFR